MGNLCSKGRCTVTATCVLFFDARPGTDGTIQIRAQVFTCETHRDELVEAVQAYGYAEVESLAG